MRVIITIVSIAAACFWPVLVCTVLFWGEPDLLDAIVAWIGETAR